MAEIDEAKENGGGAKEAVFKVYSRQGLLRNGLCMKTSIVVMTLDVNDVFQKSAFCDWK